MKRGLVCLLSVGLVVVILGCDALVGLLLPSRVTVTLANASPTFDIEVTVVYDDEEDTLKEIVILLGTDEDFIIGPGERVSFSRDCDDLRALVLEDADLLVFAGLSPEVDSDPTYLVPQDFALTGVDARTRLDAEGANSL